MNTSAEKETQKRSSRVTQRRKKFFSHFSRRMSEKVLEKKKNERKCENANKSNSWVQVGIIVVYRAIWKYRTVTDYVAKKRVQSVELLCFILPSFFAPVLLFTGFPVKSRQRSASLVIPILGTVGPRSHRLPWR